MTPIIPPRPDEPPVAQSRALDSAHEGTLRGVLIKKYNDRQLQVLMTKEGGGMVVFVHSIVYTTLDSSLLFGPHHRSHLHVGILRQG